jgi:hypothetical protein
MAKTLSAKPAVRRVNRVISLPKVAKPAALRPSATVVRTVQTAQRKKAVPSKLYQQQAVKPKRNVPLVKGIRPNKTAAHLSRQRRQIVQKVAKNPRVLYRGNEIDEASKKKIELLKNSGRGKLLIIIGNGPSLLDVDLQRLKGNPNIEIMSINKPDARIWPTDYWLFCDNSQYRRNEDLWKAYNGKLLNTTAIKNRKAGTVIIKNIGGVGFSLNLVNGFHIGRSSVFASMQAAFWMGHDHVYLFGVDMTSKIVGGKELVHFYGVNPDVAPKNRKDRFDAEAKYYDDAARSLQSIVRKKYTFCSSLLRYGFADKFNKMDHTKAVAHILKHAKTLEKNNGGE